MKILLQIGLFGMFLLTGHAQPAQPVAPTSWEYEYAVHAKGTRSESISGVLKCRGRELPGYFGHVITPIGEFSYNDNHGFGGPIQQWLPAVIEEDGRLKCATSEAAAQAFLSGKQGIFRKAPARISTRIFAVEDSIPGSFENRPASAGADWFLCVDHRLWIDPRRIYAVKFAPPAPSSLAAEYVCWLWYDTRIVTLRPDGTYLARRFTDTGISCSATGKWEAKGDEVWLVPMKEQDWPHIGGKSFRELVRREWRGMWVLVPKDDEKNSNYQFALYPQDDKPNKLDQTHWGKAVESSAAFQNGSQVIWFVEAMEHKYPIIYIGVETDAQTNRLATLRIRENGIVERTEKSSDGETSWITDKPAEINH